MAVVNTAVVREAGSLVVRAGRDAGDELQAAAAIIARAGSGNPGFDTVQVLSDLLPTLNRQATKHAAATESTGSSLVDAADAVTAWDSSAAGAYRHPM